MASTTPTSTRSWRREEGVARAFAKLDTIKNEIVWWDTHAQAPQLLADGEVSMTMAANGRIFDAIQQRQAALLYRLGSSDLEPGSLGDSERIQAVRRTAKAFIAFAADPEQLADQTKYISYGPVRKSAAAWSIPTSPTQLPTAEANFRTALQNDFQFWADHGDELNERFNVWLNQ